MDRESPSIESILKETRVFPPAAAFSQRASVKSLAEYEALYDRTAREPEKFWAEIARELSWSKPFTQTPIPRSAAQKEAAPAPAVREQRSAIPTQAAK